MSTEANYLTCLACPHRGAVVGTGMVCTVKGGIVHELAEQHACPLERFPSRGAGDSVAKAIHTLTFGMLANCSGCQERRAAMNEALPYH